MGGEGGGICDFSLGIGGLEVVVVGLLLVLGGWI